jgi:uncharacterized iron-regulated protein
MKKGNYITILVIGFIYLLAGCKKNSNPSTTATKSPALVTPAQILSSEANLVIEGNYAAFASGALSLYNGLVQMQASPTSANLANCKNLWLYATAAYEQCESFNFGPTNINGDDGLVNSFPIDTMLVDTLLGGKTVFTQNNINNLPGNYKGLHCIEYVLYGGNGSKTISQFNSRQFIYLDSIALNIQMIAYQLDTAWNPNMPGNYNTQFVTAGSGSVVYTDQKAAFEDLIYGLGNYCEIDEQTKLNNPLNSNAAQQESSFANNSVADIVNNLTGIQNCYYGQYNGTTGYGITAFVSQTNKTLDDKVKSDITAAINAANNITPNLTQALATNPALLQTAKNWCDTLDKELKGPLLNFITSNVP